LELLGGILDRIVILAAGVSWNGGSERTWLEDRVAGRVLGEDGGPARNEGVEEGHGEVKVRRGKMLLLRIRGRRCLTSGGNCGQCER
jgi:hypothetical protein